MSEEQVVVDQAQQEEKQPIRIPPLQLQLELPNARLHHIAKIASAAIMKSVDLVPLEENIPDCRKAFEPLYYEVANMLNEYYSAQIEAGKVHAWTTNMLFELNVRMDMKYGFIVLAARDVLSVKVSEEHEEVVPRHIQLYLTSPSRQAAYKNVREQVKVLDKVLYPL